MKSLESLSKHKIHANNPETGSWYRLMIVLDLPIHIDS